MRRRRGSQPAEPGQDAFLDIVANLVGILIILVMVVGASARQVFESTVVAPTPVATAEPRPVDLAGPQAAATQIESSVAQLAGKLRRYDLEIAYRRKERDRLQTLVAAADEMLRQQQAELSQQQQSAILQRQALAQQERLLQATQAQVAAMQHATAPREIKHLPTPIAKTVFGKELHFRLARGRLSYVPFEDFVALLKRDAQGKIGRLRNSEKFTESVGPIGDYQMRYVMKRSQRKVDTPLGPSVQELAELDFFELVPLADDVGEPLDRALADGSDFIGRVKHEDPGTTTVTVWVYPDGFDQYRAVKQRLSDLGYLSAARPLPKDQLIGGAPDGRRSAAQ